MRTALAPAGAAEGRRENNGKGGEGGAVFADSLPWYCPLSLVMQRNVEGTSAGGGEGSDGGYAGVSRLPRGRPDQHLAAGPPGDQREASRVVT
jgi:hypothetical protein